MNGALSMQPDLLLQNPEPRPRMPMQPLTTLPSTPVSSLPEFPLVSIVIETVNEETDPDIDLSRVLAGLKRQTYPQDRIEILICIDARNQKMIHKIGQTHPHVSVVVIQNSHYFAMKREGTMSAKGDIIAILDSDCEPCSVWVQTVVDHIRDGADVVAGKTRYPKGAPYAHTFNFFNFGYIHGDAHGRASGFLPNNAAFRRDVIREHNFDTRIRRGGAGHLLGNKLRHLNYRLDYAPRQLATHNIYGIGEELKMRIKSGYEIVTLAKVDADGFLEESRVLRAAGHLIGLTRILVRRFLFDVRLLFRNRQDLDISPIQIPYFLILSPCIRGLEFVTAIITLVNPRYYQKKYDW